MKGSIGYLATFQWMESCGYPNNELVVKEKEMPFLVWHDETLDMAISRVEHSQGIACVRETVREDPYGDLPF